MKILITGGGTTEKIDDMRTVSNFSTGATSIKLAEILSQDHDITLMLSTSIKYSNDNLTIVKFDDCESMLLNFKNLSFIKFDMIIQAAAVSDYQVLKVKVKDEEVSFSKIPSGLDNLSIEFKRAPKIINRIKMLYPETFLVGFKLSSELEFSEYSQSIKRVFNDAKADLIIHNDLAIRKEGKDYFNIFKPNLKFEKVKNISKLASGIIDHYNKTLLKGAEHDSLS